MMIDTNRPHNSKVARPMCRLFGGLALALAAALAGTPLVGTAAAAPAVQIAANSAEIAAPGETDESSVAVAIVRNRAQMAAARKEREKVREQVYAMRSKFEKDPAAAELRRAAREANEAYDKKRETDPDLKAAREAEDALDEALDALVLAKVKASLEGAALVRKIADLEEERASLSLVHAVAEVKLTHRDSPITRALDNDKELAGTYKLYKAADKGPVRDKARADYYAARKAAMGRMPDAVALITEMASAKKGMDAAYKARYAARKQFSSLQSKIKHDRSDAEIAAAYNKLGAARKAAEKAYNAPAIQAARDARSETSRAYGAKTKALMAADAEVSALQARYNAIKKEIRDLEDEARALRKKQSSKKTGAGPGGVG